MIKKCSKISCRLRLDIVSLKSYVPMFKLMAACYIFLPIKKIKSNLFFEHLKN